MPPGVLGETVNRYNSGINHDSVDAIKFMQPHPLIDLGAFRLGNSVIAMHIHNTNDN